MTDKEKAARVRECVRIFSTGCSNTMSFKDGKVDPGTPEECEECTAVFLEQVRKAVA